MRSMYHNTGRLLAHGVLMMVVIEVAGNCWPHMAISARRTKASSRMSK